MSDSQTRKGIFWLFSFVYMPFLWRNWFKFTPFPNDDFTTFYWVSNLVFKERRSPFVSDTLPQAKATFGQTVFPYLYPPPSILAFAPLSIFSHETARLLMLSVNHLCVLLFIYLFFFKLKAVDVSRSARGLAAAVSIVYLFGYAPFSAEFRHGQIDLIVLVLICLTWYGEKTKWRSWLIALPLSVAILLKTYPLLFVLLLLTRRRYNAVVWVFGLLLLYTVAAYVVLPQSVWGDWFANVYPTAGYGKTPFNLGSPAYPWNESINGFTSRLFLKNEFTEALLPSAAAGRIVPYLLSLGVVGITFGCSYLASRRDKAGRLVDFEFSLYLLAMFMVAPLSWEQHLIFVLPPALIMICLLFVERQSYLTYMFVIPSLFILAYALPLESPGLAKGAMTLGISVKLYAVTTIWVFFVRQVLRFTEEEQPIEVQTIDHRSSLSEPLSV